MSLKTTPATGRATLNRISSLLFVLFLVCMVVLMFMHISSAFATLSANN